MAITPNNYSFSGGAFMGGSDSSVTRDDIHTLTIKKNGENIGNYNPLVGDADIDIPGDGFVCSYGTTTATQIYNAKESGKEPYLYQNGIVVPLWKVEADKYTFRTTHIRDIGGANYLDIVDYVVEGSVWSTVTQTISGRGGGSQQAYLKKASSLAVFDTTGKTGTQTVAYVNDVPEDGVYQVSVMLSVTPKTVSPTKSDLVFGFYGSAGIGMPDHTFHAVVDDSQTFAQQLSFSTTLNLKAGTNSLKLVCGGFATQYLVFVDNLTVAQIVNGVYHNGDDFSDVHTLTEAPDFNDDDNVLVDGVIGGPRRMSKGSLLTKTAQNAVNSSVASGIEVAELGHRRDIGTYAAITAGWYMKPDGTLERNADYNLFVYDASSFVGKYLYSESNYVFSTSTSVSNRLTERVSGVNLTPTSALYIIVCSQSKPTVYELSYEESAKQEDSVVSLNTSLGSKTALFKLMPLGKQIQPASSFPTSTLNEDGTAKIENGMTLWRYDVQYNHGKTILIESNDGYVFSSSTATAEHIGNKSSYLKFSDKVPDNAVSLFISSTDDFTPSVTIIQKSADYNTEEFVDDSLELGDPIPSSDLNGYNIGPSGTAYAATDYRLTRCSVDGLDGKYLKIDFFGEGNLYCFSTTLSASNKITNGLNDEFIKVPTGAKYIIIGAPKTEKPYVRVVNPSSEYGEYGIQLYVSEEKTYRLKKAIGCDFSVNDATGLASSDFDNKFPWSEMRLCNIEFLDGKPLVTYNGETGFSLSNETFVEIPKFYFKREIFEGRERLSISDKGGNGFVIEPWFVGDDGKELPVRYIARYPLSSLGISVSGGSPSITNKSTAKTQMQTAGFQLCGIDAYQALIHLFLVETGTKNSQSLFPGVSYYRFYTNDMNYQLNPTGSTNTIKVARVSDRDTWFGVGDRVLIFPTESKQPGSAEIRNLVSVSSDDSYVTFVFDGDPINLVNGVSRIFGFSQLNGKTDGIFDKTGFLNNGSKMTRPFTYRGIENLYGNLGEIIDDLSYDNDNNRFYFKGIPLNFVIPRNESYVEASTPKWIKTFGRDARLPSLLLPSGDLGSVRGQSFYGEWSTFGTGRGDVCYGCAWDHNEGNGILTFRGLNDNAGGNLYSFRAML